MSRPKSVKKEYPFSMLYIVNYYLDNIDFYDYRSSNGRYPYFSVGLEESGTKLPALTTNAGSVNYIPTQYKSMKDALLRFLQKRKVFNYIIKEHPGSDLQRVKSLVDFLHYK